MSFWEEMWRRQEEFLSSGRGDLRHGISSVWVSSLAGQLYCEYKVENGFVHGEIPTEEKDDGTALHDELIPQEPITKERFASLVTRREPSYAVLPVWGIVGDIRVVGMPDHIIWSDGRPLWVVELKTTRGDPAALWDDQRTQVLIYGALLSRMGFDCSQLRLALVRVRSDGLSEDEKQKWVRVVSQKLEHGQADELERRNPGRMKVHVIKQDVAAADAAVRRMQGYWLGKREPTSSTSVNKCRACEYSSVCPRSLVK